MLTQWRAVDMSSDYGRRVANRAHLTSANGGAVWIDRIMRQNLPESSRLLSDRAGRMFAWRSNMPGHQ